MQFSGQSPCDIFTLLLGTLYTEAAVTVVRGGGDKPTIWWAEPGHLMIWGAV